VPHRLFRLIANGRLRIYVPLCSCKQGKIVASLQCPPFQLIGITMDRSALRVRYGSGLEVTVPIEIRHDI
jgi:hypothetical protein